MKRFECIELAVKLARETCGKRHLTAIRHISGTKRKGEATLVEARTCADCPVGRAHSVGRAPRRWSDGTPIRLVEARARSAEHTDLSPPAPPPEKAGRRAPRGASPSRFGWLSPAWTNS